MMKMMKYILFTANVDSGDLIVEWEQMAYEDNIKYVDGENSENLFSYAKEDLWHQHILSCLVKMK